MVAAAEEVDFAVAGAVVEEEAAATIIVVDEAAVDMEITRATAERVAESAPSGLRRRTFSICPSTRTRRSGSNLLAAGKVRDVLCMIFDFFCASLLHLLRLVGARRHVGRVLTGRCPRHASSLGLPADHDSLGLLVTGTLKGYDPLMNLVLDEVKETMRDDAGNETARPLGLTVARGTMIVLISPLDGSEEIANPFAPAAED